MLQDYKLGLRMLRKYPGLTLAGGLALVIAIGIGTAWYDISGKFLSPTIPLPEGDRLVTIETMDTSTSEAEQRVAREFLEWRRELRTIVGLGAFRTDTRNLVVGNGAPEPIRMAALTAAAFGAARVPPLLGRGLLDSDEAPGAPSVIVLGYDLWQRSFGRRQDVAGTVVKLGNTSTTVVGVMPKGFAYPINYTAWTPLSLRASYGALEGDAIEVIGRLAPGVTQEQADAEVRVLGERAAAALPATHQHLKPRVLRLGEASDVEAASFAMRNLPVLLVLIIACMSVGTLIYARTATREDEIAVRSALGANRRRIIGQLFVEALVLASVAAAVGVIAADRVVLWVVENFNRASGGVPFWLTPGLKLSTIFYAGILATVSAVMLSLLPALKATRAGLQSQLQNRAAGGATLRFGHIWTGAMIVQVALTAIGIPVALENVNEARRNASIRAAFPSREYLAARLDVDRPNADETMPAFEVRRARTFEELQRRIAQEPGVVAVAFADRVPGSGGSRRAGQVETSAGAAPVYTGRFWTSTVSPGFFEMFERPIVAGRAFHEGDRSPGARTVIVNEALARAFARSAGGGSPIGARLRYSATSQTSASPDASVEPWFEIVGVVRDFGLDPDDLGHEKAFVFHTATTDTLSPFVMSVRTRGNPATLAARLPVMAADVDASLLVGESRSLEEWIKQGDGSLISTVATQSALPGLGLFLSAMSIFSLVSVSVSRRRREIGVRAALGAKTHHLLTGIMSRALIIMGSGITIGSALLLVFVARNWSAEDVVLYARYLAVTCAVMLAACLCACIGPARRALAINPAEALKDA